MKKKLVIFFSIFLIGVWQNINTESVSIVVPKQCLIEKASLVLYMMDGLGNQSIGTCRLHEAFEQRNIMLQDLQIQAQESIDKITNSIDVTHNLQPSDHEIVLHIEFDQDIQVVRVLVVKDNLLAEDPFDVLSIPVGDMVESFDEFDCLSDLVSDIDTVVENTVTTSKKLTLSQSVLYVQIFMMMQYKHAKRKLKDFTSWLCKKR